MIYWFLLEAKNQLVQNLIFFSGLVFSMSLTRWGAIAEAVWGYALLSGITIGVRAMTFGLSGGRSLPESQWIQDKVAAGLAKGTSIAFVILVIISFYVSSSFGWLCLALIGLGMLHDFLFRHEPLVDVLTIAIEFVCKAAAGAAILNVETSPWLVLCTFVTAMLLAIGQRRNELIQEEAKPRRPVLEKYTATLLDQMVAVAASSSLIAYSLYTVNERTIEHLGTKNLVYSIPFVLYGIMRYLYLVYTKDVSLGVEKVLAQDAPLLLTIFVWFAFILIVVY